MSARSRVALRRLGLLVVLCSPTGPVRAALLNVGGPDGFPSIQTALKSATAGDTVVVAAGTYREVLAIDKPLSLVGRPGAHVSGDRHGSVIVVLADDVRISGFEVSGSGSQMMASDAGINVLGARARITDNRLRDNLFGIYLRGCHDAVVEGNTIRGREEDDIGMRGAGVHIFDARRNIIRKNHISCVRDGVYFDHADFNTVEGNDFSDLRYGVHYMYCRENRFYGNIFRNSMGGVAVMYTERVTFRDNQILNNRKGYNAFGLLLKDCLDSIAEANIIVNNVNGIFLDNSHRNRFLMNLVAYNDTGVVLHGNSLGNAFSSNDFIGNLATLHTVGKPDADWAPGGMGNYYSDYRGFDLDGDGVGDTAHSLQDAFEYLEGSRPRLRLFLNSAAADALAAAEKSFPIVPTSDEWDPAPKMKPVSGTRLPSAYDRPGGPRSSRLLAIGSFLLLLLVLWLSGRARR